MAWLAEAVRGSVSKVPGRASTVMLAAASATLLAVQIAAQGPVSDVGAVGAPQIVTQILQPGVASPDEGAVTRGPSAADDVSVPGAVLPPSAGLTINAVFDATITSDPNAAAIEATINTAIANLQSMFSDPITVTITFKKDLTISLGQSSTYFANVSYSTFLAALKADAKTSDDAAAIALLPSLANNPVNASATINVKTANLRAVGIVVNPPAGQSDGTISVKTSITNPGSPGTSGVYNLLPVVEHEIDEVLGLGSSLPTMTNSTIFPEDLYRYDQNGARTFTTTSSVLAFFSVNGTTALAQFDNQNDGGDFGDWQSSPHPLGVLPKVQDAFATPGSNPALSVELTALDVLGYDRASVPPSITVQPANVTVTVGQHPQFTVAATGIPTPTYQWQLSIDSGLAWTNLTDGGPYQGSSTANLVVTAAQALNGYQFRAVATNTAGAATSSAAVLTISVRPKVLTDMDGDGKADLAVFRPSSGNWFVANSTTGYASNTVHQFGLPGDVPVPGDYDGDGIADLAVYRPSNGFWYILQSSTNFTTSLAFQWGVPGDVPVPGDYDGDGKLDPAVYRASSGVWYVLTSSSHYDTAAPITVGLGLSTDIPVPGDYDGDGTTDPAVYRPSTGTWYIRQSSTGGTTSLAFQWGLGGDVPVPGDYDGDGKTDLGVFRPGTGTWYIRQSTTSYTTFVTYQWGLPGDVAVQGDYDGDGRADLAVFRPATGTWYIRQSTTSYTTSVVFQWGLPGDTPGANNPVANALAASSGKPTVSTLANQTRFSDFDGDGKADLTVFRPASAAWYTLRSSTNFTIGGTFLWGLSGDIPVPGDYDGDGKTDLAVYRPSTGTWWYVLRSTSTFPTYLSVLWGLPGDIPVPGDYDGDGKTDFAVYRPSNGFWYILQSSTNFTTSASFQWGLPGDVPLPGDYDGDGVTDLALWRPSNGTWYIRYSSLGYSVANAGVFQWGLNGDIAVPGDYDGDGKTDLAVYRPSTSVWYIRQSSTSYVTSVAYQWGIAGDAPVPGDFDGDGKTDLAVFRPSTAVWYLLRSSTSFTTSVSYPWGLSGDVPILKRP